MKNLENTVSELIEMVSTYQIEEAYQNFYSDNFHAYENAEGPRIGIDKALERYRAEKNQMQCLFRLEAASWMCKKDTAMIHWICEFKDLTGKTWQVEEVALSKWKDGKIYEEKYVYNAPVLTPAPSLNTTIYHKK